MINLDAFLSSLAKAGEAQIEKVQEVGQEMMEEAFLISQASVPTDTGALEASGRREETSEGVRIIYGDQATGRYGNPTSSYAAPVHEGISLRWLNEEEGKTSTRVYLNESKYLEQAMNVVFGDPGERLARFAERIDSHGK